MFAVNVGTLDRIVRIAIGLLLVVLAAYGKIGVWGYLGLVPLITGLTARCPAYSLFGVRSR